MKKKISVHALCRYHGQMKLLLWITNHLIKQRQLQNLWVLLCIHAQTARCLTKTRILDSLLFASALAYFVIYFFVVYLQSDLLYLGAAPSLIDYLKRFVNYAFFTDSFIYLIRPEYELIGDT